MLQRLIAAVLAVLGVAAVALGVASATAWRADDPLVATAAPGGTTRALVTDPGVLELAGDPVTVTVRAEGSPVVLAVGRDTDVDGWLGDDPYVRVTGLSDWHTLATTSVEAPAPEPSGTATADARAAAASPSPSATGDADEVAPAADPTGSDMWLVEVSGDGSATLEWPARDGRWSLLAVSLGDTAPVLDLAWPQTVTTPWLWPGVALGVLLLAVAAVLLVRILRARGQGPEAGWHAVATGQIAVVAAPGTPAGGTAVAGAPAADSGTAPVTGAVPLGVISATGAPLTRRQIREAEAAAAAAAAAARRRGRRGATGAIPVVTGALPTVTGATPAAGDRPGAGDAGTGPAATPPGPGASGPGSSGPVSSGPGATGDGAGGPVPAAGRAGAPAGSPERPAAPAPAPSATAATAPAGTPTSDAGPGSVPTGAPGPRGPGAGAPGSRPVASAPAASPAQPSAFRPAASPARPAAPAPAAPPAQPSAPAPAPRTPTGPEAGPDAAPPPGVAPAGEEQRAPGRERRGLGSRLPWRRSRTDSSSADTAAADVAGTGTTPSWSPLEEPSTGAAGTAPRGTPVGAATPVPPPDEAASPAQRADAWRRMWGFPSEGDTPVEDRTADRDDDQPTEEGR